MSLPYENATSGSKALSDLQSILSNFGCDAFGTMTYADKGEVMVQFRYRSRMVQVSASSKGYAARWLRENPWTTRRSLSRPEHERKALAIGEVAVYSILRDWIKGQVTAIECGILSFEGAFLGQILLANGKTVLEHAMAQQLLPSPQEQA